MPYLPLEIKIWFFGLLAILGLSAGSFISCITYQINKENFSLKSIWRRSKCPKCGRKLSVFDNVPLLSYILLSGKCRTCQKRISKRYPLLELAGLATFLLVGLGYILEIGIIGEYKSQLDLWSLPYILFLATGLLAITVADLENQIIPDVIVISLISIHLLLLTFFISSPVLFTNFFAGSAASIFFLTLCILTRGRGMGLGDVKLAFLIGIIAGPVTWVAIFLAFVIGAGFGLLMVGLGRARFGKPIPFGPFLVLGTFIVMLLGDKIEIMLLGGVV